VARFNWHVTDGKKTYRDASGMNVTDAAPAESFARIVANDLRADGPYYNYYVDVRDQDGNPAGKVYVVKPHRQVICQ
jgi:hypothetical protein